MEQKMSRMRFMNTEIDNITMNEALVVIDEMVGVWIPLLAVPDNAYTYGYVLAAFVLFRLLDIFKPLGIRKMENLKGGVGIMMDDILAGIYSFIILMGVRCIAG